MKQRFHADVIEFVRANTGAKRAATFDYTIRKRLSADLSAQTTVSRPAVLLVHSDYTVSSGPQRVRDIVPDEAEDLLTRRVAFFNVWKSLRDPVEELPLAMCDATSQNEGDMLRMELNRERTGEIHVMRHAASHRWSCFPGMTAAKQEVRPACAAGAVPAAAEQRSGSPCPVAASRLHDQVEHGIDQRPERVPVRCAEEAHGADQRARVHRTGVTGTRGVLVVLRAVWPSWACNMDPRRPRAGWRLRLTGKPLAAA